MATETLRPEADGTYKEITAATTSRPYYVNVDEAVADDDTTVVSPRTAGSWVTDTYELPAHTGSGTINHVTVYARYRARNALNVCKIAIYTHSTLYQGDEESCDGDDAYHNISKQWITNPNTGLAWTWDEIDALEAGISGYYQSGAFYPYCTQIYVEVDYTPAVAVRSRGYIIG